MTKNTTTQFTNRYQTALRLHLQHPTRGLLPPRSAQLLGRTALSLGLDTLDLAGVHDRAAAAVAAPRLLTHGRNGNGPLTRAGIFFLEALRPIEQTHAVARRTAGHALRLDGLLRKRTAALSVTRRQMRQEIARREVGEKKLAQGAEHNSRLLAQSRRMQDQARNLAHQVLAAQEEERKEISRELHDEVAQILAGINVQLAALKEAAAINSRNLRQRIAQTQRLVAQSVEIVHRYARELRPALLDDLGLIPALRSYIRNLSGRKGLRIRLTAFAQVEALDNSRRTVLYRVAQEALTNVVRHAHARFVTVRIHQFSNAVRLEVHNDGKCFRVDRMLASRTNKRLGLLGMRERVEMVGGNFAIWSAPGQGTTVRAEIPVRGRQRGPNS